MSTTENQILTPIEGRPVFSVAIEMPNIGGGLRDALDVDPVEHHIGEEVMIIARARMKRLKADEIKDTQGLQRVEVFDAVAVGFATGKLESDCQRALNKDAERIAAAKAQRELDGQGTLEDLAANGAPDDEDGE